MNTELVSKWMIERSYATGHGDTVEDLLKELEWQAKEREREACAKYCERAAKMLHGMEMMQDYRRAAEKCAELIRSRGEIR
jgi:hypothetical protein